MDLCCADLVRGIAGFLRVDDIVRWSRADKRLHDILFDIVQYYKRSLEEPDAFLMFKRLVAKGELPFLLRYALRVDPLCIHSVIECVGRFGLPADYDALLVFLLQQRGNNCYDLLMSALASAIGRYGNVAIAQHIANNDSRDILCQSFMIMHIIGASIRHQQRDVFELLKDHARDWNRSTVSCVSWDAIIPLWAGAEILPHITSARTRKRLKVAMGEDLDCGGSLEEQVHFFAKRGNLTELQRIYSLMDHQLFYDLVLPTAVEYAQEDVFRRYEHGMTSDIAVRCVRSAFRRGDQELARSFLALISMNAQIANILFPFSPSLKWVQYFLGFFTPTLKDWEVLLLTFPEDDVRLVHLVSKLHGSALTASQGLGTLGMPNLHILAALMKDGLFPDLHLSIVPNLLRLHKQ